MEGLLAIISDAYDHYEQNLELLQRAIELSSIELNQSKSKISNALTLLNEKNEDLLSSIHYARLIQEAILPSEDRFHSALPESFVFHRPRDIVSGDFYWLQEYDDKILIAAVDCTGHGVPGAFMSIIGNNALNAAVREEGLTTPALILDSLNRGVSSTLRHQKDEDHQGTAGIKDGMDIALISIDYKNKQIQYSGAYNPLYIIRDGKLLETKGDKFPIGLALDDGLRLFTNHTFDLIEGDMVYIFSDGYPDQFGGPIGKKFKYDNFRSLLFDIHELSPRKQLKFVEQRFNEWKGDLVQLDDVLLIGMRL
ncbi:MAG: SpoIIE family protein phosphatase [Flavobacteriales bacterium]|nr:SpoIIE family protein phosphatase [Flavobacteriales bacterium]